MKITFQAGANELEILDNENRRKFFEERHFTEVYYPFTIEPNFSTLGSFIEISRQEPLTGLTPDDKLRVFFGFDASAIYEEYNLSTNPVDIISSEKKFPETDIAQGMIFKGNRTAIIHDFTRDVDPENKNTEKFRGGVHWYMMKSRNFDSKFSFTLKHEIGNIVSFKCQSITFILSVQGNYFYTMPMTIMKSRY